MILTNERKVFIMMTYAFYKTVGGKVYAERLQCKCGDSFEDKVIKAKALIEKLNKNFKPNSKYSELLFLKEAENFTTSKDCDNWVEKIISEVI